MRIKYSSSLSASWKNNVNTTQFIEASEEECSSITMEWHPISKEILVCDEYLFSKHAWKTDLTFAVRSMDVDANEWSFQQPTAQQMKQAVDSRSAWRQWRHCRINIRRKRVGRRHRASIAADAGTRCNIFSWQHTSSLLQHETCRQTSNLKPNLI